MKTYTSEEITSYITAEWGPQAAQVIAQVNTWLARGDGIAIYVNQDLGHPDLGMPKMHSYGSSSAQLETDTPPERLPDIGGAINWRYMLQGTYRGDALRIPGDLKP